MPVQEPQQALSPDQIRTQLQKVLASPRFQRAPRQSRLLHYLVEAALRGNRPGLTEAVIAREAFDRTAGFDPSSNREVATTVGRLRKSLESYHRTDGLQDSVEIQLPLGSHLPVVCPSGRAAEAAASPQPIPVRSSADPRPGPAGQPIDFRIDVSTLVVLEAQGREVGRKQFDAPLAQEAYRGTDHISRCAFADVDRDGAVEILFVEVPQYWGNTGMKLCAGALNRAARTSPTASGAMCRRTLSATCTCSRCLRSMRRASSFRVITTCTTRTRSRCSNRGTATWPASTGTPDTCCLPPRLTSTATAWKNCCWPE
jgi:hypothetical protein